MKFDGFLPLSVRSGGVFQCHETAILGMPAFMFPRQKDGSRPPGDFGSLGYEIEDDVFIFPMAMVVNGTDRATLIERGARIGPRAQVGHDVRVGKHCCIGANAVLCGFSEIGEFTTLGVGVRVVPFVKIGRNCFIMAGAVVTKDVPDNSVMAGVPAVLRRVNDQAYPAWIR